MAIGDIAAVERWLVDWRTSSPAGLNGMDNKFYYETIDQLQRSDVSPEYIQGWIGGYMGNPRREEQRTTPAYDAGYDDGENGSTDTHTEWLQG